MAQTDVDAHLLQHRHKEVELAGATSYFRNIENELICKINEHPVVVGCVAWLTNERILKALLEQSLQF